MVDFLLFSSKEKRNKRKMWTKLQQVTKEKSLENHKFTHKVNDCVVNFSSQAKEENA